MLTRAFMHDPSHEYLFPDMAKRESQLIWLFERWVRALVPLGAFYITEGGEGVACWIPPEHNPGLSLWAMLRAGMARIPFRYGLRWARRAWIVQADVDRLHHNDLKEPHWILEMLAVDPEHHRKGVGSALLKPMLERADRERMPCYVMTHNPINPAYYQRHGFQILQQQPKSETDLFVCTLRREIGGGA